MFVWTFGSIVIAVSGTSAAILRKDNKVSDGINGFYPIFNLNTIKGLFIFFLVLGLTLGLAYVGSNPFIYFQF